MHALTRRQLILLICLTLIWGFNWPVMKMGVNHYPPMSFRSLSLILGLPVLALGLKVLKVPFHVPRAHWRAVSWLALTNMIIWQGLIILAVKNLSSGRAAILGYSMPIFSAVLGSLVFGATLAPRAWGGVVAAALGVILLLWHELANLSGSPIGVALALFAAATWALGTQQMRRTTLPLQTLTISFWMTVLTAVVMIVSAVLFERDQWGMPPPDAVFAIVYNAVLIFGFAMAVWFSLARDLPPVASTLSVMFIPILGVFSGAWLLGEVLHWQDWAAVLLMVAAIGSVLLPERSR